jgi:hypothetical protein
MSADLGFTSHLFMLAWLHPLHPRRYTKAEQAELEKEKAAEDEDEALGALRVASRDDVG